jgi:nicotinate-nucleotide adenylyltransferase
MKTGLFGGTFDPIHNGHLIVAESVRSNCGLDRIVFIPSGCPPHKDPGSYSGPDIRLDMVNLAIRDYPQFEISTIELYKTESAYAIDTIRDLQNDGARADDSLHYIIGADSLLDLHTWRDPDDILQSIKTLVVPRPGFDPEKADKRFREQVSMVNTPLISISSTEIRRRVREGKSIQFWVPDTVRTYIEEKGLYR